MGDPAMTRGILSPDARLHLEIAEVLRTGTEAEADAALKRCPDGECMKCAMLVCPHGEPLHFHHDGCPACAERDV